MKNSNLLKDFIKKICKNKYVPYLIILLLGIVTTIPLFTMNLSKLNEFRIHIIRITSIKEAIQDGVFPPYISYKHMMDFGYALNIFYGSLTTYIPIVISFFTRTNTIALKVYTLITVILSGITMYLFAYKVTNRKTAGLIASLIYMAAPYKFTDIYSRNAVGEYTAFIFIPMIFQGIWQLLNEEKKGNYWLVAGASLLVLTHTITTIYTALLAILFLLFNFNKIKNIKLWKSITIDVVCILLLTSFYTIPLVEHKLSGDYVIFDAEKMRATAADTYENTNKITDWFESELSHDELIFSFGLAMTFLMFITIFCYKKIDKKYKKDYIVFGLLSIISLYMCTKAFPWIFMPHFFTVIQFAWRMNGFFIFFISLICGINAYTFSETLSSIRYTIIVLIIAVIFTMGGFGVSKYIEHYDKSIDDNYEGKLLELTIIGPYNVNRDYMPLRASNNMEYLKSREDRTYLLNGKATIISENKSKLQDIIEIENVENAKLELPYLYYCGYTVKINGKTIKNYESENGFVCVDVNENGKLEINYTGTRIEKIGFIISFASLIIIGFVVNRNERYS